MVCKAKSKESKEWAVIKPSVEGLESARYIPLTKGVYTLVDSEYFDYINQWTWCTKVNSKGVPTYAARINLETGERVQVIVHRLVYSIHYPNADLTSLDIDHVNRDKLDNRVSNLRLASRTSNSGNRGPNSNNKSGYKGVNLYDESRGVWRAQIMISGKKVSIGYYITAEEAAIAYNKKAVETFGEFAFLNDVSEDIVPEPLVYRNSATYSRGNKE